MSKVTDFSEAPALTLWQPYAHAAAIRLKGFETRGWETWHRGQLFIHAAKRWDREQEALWRKTCVELLELDLSETATYRPGGISGKQVYQYAQQPILGAIVAVVDLVECWPTDGTPPPGRGLGILDMMDPVERMFGDFSKGRYAFQLENVIRLEIPVECKGRQGLWYPSAEVVDRIKDQLRGAAA